MDIGNLPPKALWKTYDIFQSRATEFGVMVIRREDSIRCMENKSIRWLLSTETTNGARLQLDFPIQGHVG